MDFSDAIGRKFEIFASLTEAQALDASFVSEHPAAMCFCKDTHSIVFGGVVVSPDSAEAKLKTIYQADMLTVMDGLTIAGEWMAKAQAVQGSYLVMYDSTKSCGVVEMFMDAMGHGLTQVYTTTGTLTDGVFDSGHEDGVVRKYVRHFGVMISGNYDPGVWTDWELVWSSEDKATYEDVTEVLTDHEERIENAEDSLADVLTTVYNLGEFPSVSEGLTAAAEKSITENRNIRLITFVVPTMKQSVNILQQHFNYITTQVVFLEGESRTSYQRSITTGDNYVVGDLQQLHLYTTIQVEGNELVGYTADTPDSPNTKRTVICSLDLDSVATLEAQSMRTIIEVAGVDYTTTTFPTSSIQTTGLPLYWLARPANFAVKSGTTYYTMPRTDERFAACGLRRVGQLFKCGGETFYLDADLNPVFVNSSVRFDRSGTSVKVYPSNSTLRSLYEAAGAVWNEDTGYYELNGVNDIDEEEMQGIFVKSNNVRLGGYAYYKYQHRTIITPIGFSQSENLINLFYASYIVSVPDPTINYFGESPALYGFAGFAQLRSIGQTKAFLSVKDFGSGPFVNAKELVQVLIRSNRTTFTIKDSLRISYYSLNYLATNASGTAFTVTLPTPQATIINTILATSAGVVDDLTPEEQNIIFQQLAQMPWEAKLKVEYTQPIWREDNGSTIAFTNRMPQLDEAGETYTFQDVAYNDVRPSLIKHEKGANGEYIYAAWYDYVNKMLVTDRNKVGTELAQYTTALNTNFAVSIYDWIDLANKFARKNITIADGGAAAASATEE